MDLHQEDIDVVQAMSLLAAQFGCTITGVTTKWSAKQGYPVGQIEIDGPEENQVALAQAINELLAERGKKV